MGMRNFIHYADLLEWSNGEMVVWEYSKDTVDAKVYNTIHKEMEGNVPMKSYTLFNQWSIKLHSQH